MADELDRRLEPIQAELNEVLNDLAGTHAMALMGISRVKAWAEQNPPPSLTAESMLMIGSGNPNGTNFSYQRWPWLSLAGRLDAGGEVTRRIGQQWLVMVVSQWEDHFRGRIAEANGLEKKSEFKEPGFGDLNKLRNDVVHHRGVATAANAGRCQTFRWFEEGETITISMGHVEEFMDYMGLIEQAPRGDWQVRETL